MESEIVNIDEIEKTILAFAKRDFSKRMKLSSNFNSRDIIASGINMLGEELEQTTISRDYFSNIYNAVSDIMIVVDNNGIIKDVNNATQIVLGKDKESLLGRNYRDFIPKGGGLYPTTKKPINFETLFQKGTGTYFHIDCSISPIIDRYDKHDGYLIIAKDISEKKKKKEQELKLVISTQENERKRFARDMHDSLGQELNAINLSLSTLEHIGKKGEQYDEIFKKCRYMAGHSIGTLNKIAFDLMPKSLEDGNLSQALRELAVSLNDLYQINYHFDDCETVLEDYVQVIIYRIFQEFISNSIKHANSLSINLLMKIDSKKIVFVLSDDGKGFKVDNTKSGNGIKNIKTRLESINANYAYLSEPSKGTTLKFNIIL